MRKFILMSVLLATFWIPLSLVKHSDIRKGLRLVQKRFLVFCVAYVIAIVYIVPRL